MIRPLLTSVMVFFVALIAGRLRGAQVLWYPNQTANPPTNETVASWNDALNWTLYSDFTMVPPVPETGPVPAPTDDVIFSGNALSTQPPAQAQFTATYAVLGDFIKQTASGNIPYAANASGTTTVNSLTVNSGGFTFDFGANIPPGNNTLPGNTSGLTVTADTGFQVGTTTSGGSGSTTLTVTGAGQLNTADAQIGIGAGVNGAVTLTGAQTKWVDSGGANGGIVIGNSFNGDLSAGTGTINVNGGATLNANAGLTVGNTPNANGTLNVTGATCSAAYLLIAGQAGSMGTATVSGASTVTTSGMNPLVVVGFGGTGSLSVSGNGTSFSAGSDLRIGNNANSSGSVSVQQAGALGVTGVLGVGISGQGSLTATGPATVTVGSDIIIGNSTGSNGGITIQQGASMTGSGGLGVGIGVDMTSGVGGGVGSLTITGTNSLATIASSAIIGNSTAGACTVAIQQGGHLSVDVGAATRNLTFDLAAAAGSIGQLTVSGGNSLLSTTGLGQGPGTATVTVQNGGAIAANVFEIGGATTGGSGQVTVSGTNSSVAVTLGNATLANGFLGIGQFAQGTMSITSGGTASAPFVLIGEHPGGVGQITVSGTGSNLQTTQILSVGTGYVPSQGLDVGPNGGNGTLQVSTGGSVRVSQQLAMGNAGTVSLDGTGVMVIGSGALPATPATLLVSSGGTLSGTGTISANVAFTSSTSSSYAGAIVDGSAGATHSLSLASPAGTLTLTGTSTFTGGTTIGAGVLAIGADAALGTAPASAATNVTFNGTAPGGTLRLATGFTGGSIAGTRRVVVNSASAGTLDTNGNSATWGGSLSNSGAFTKAGAGTINIGGLTAGSGSTIIVSGGTLRMNVSAASTIGSGASVTVAAGATLELAGATSALSAGTTRAAITNNSVAPGILVSGTHQQVGAIGGTGSLQVNAGSDLTANHVIQSALAIAGSSASHATLTIGASDSSGNSFAAADLAQPSFVPQPPASGDIAPMSLASSDALLGVLAGHGDFSRTDAFGAGGLSTMGAAVPEPSAILAALLGVAILGQQALRRRAT